MSKRYSGKSQKDRSFMKKAKLSLKAKRKLKERRKIKKIFFKLNLFDLNFLASFNFVTITI